jgi:hypothetical protein
MLKAGFGILSRLQAFYLRETGPWYNPKFGEEDSGDESNDRQ